jgi:hypothetical protein
VGEHGDLLLFVIVGVVRQWRPFVIDIIQGDRNDTQTILTYLLMAEIQ